MDPVSDKWPHENEDAIPPHFRSLISPYAIKRLGTLRELENAEGWCRIMYYEVEWPVLLRLVRLPFSRDRFADILLGYIYPTIYAYAAIFPHHLREEWIATLLASEDEEVALGAITLVTSFHNQRGIEILHSLAAVSEGRRSEWARRSLRALQEYDDYRMGVR